MNQTFLSPEILEVVQKELGLSNLTVELRSDWGSQSQHHRESIHQAVKAKMAKAYPLSDSSISHCPSLGGFAFTSFDVNSIVQLGFDVEEISRITPVISQRICKTKEEFAAAPSAAHLWCAKEAAYKSLKGPKQPKVVSELELFGWENRDSQFETVRLKDLQKFNFSVGTGAVIESDGFIFAFFACSP